MEPYPSVPSPWSEEDLRIVDRFLTRSPVDDATVWLATPDDQALEAIHSVTMKDVVGLRQQTARGLVSQVYATGLPLLEADVSQRTGHDPSIGEKIGRATRAMMVVPLAARGEIIGVLSAVQFADGHPDRPLRPSDLAELETLGRKLESRISPPDSP